MKAVVVAVVLLSLLGVVLSQNVTCNNPMFRIVYLTHPIWAELAFLDDPAVLSGDNFGICPDLKDVPQCCSEIGYNAITRVWASARIAIELTVQRWERGLQLFEAERDVLEQIYDNITESTQLTESQKEALRNLFDRVFTAVDNFISGAIDNWYECARAWLRYWAGLVCFSCRTDWNTYITQDLSGRYVLRLNSNTCNAVRGGCEPFWQLFVDFFNELSAALTEFTAAFGGTSGPSDGGFSFGNDICDGDCGKWICDVFFGGLDYDDAAVPDAKRSVVRLDAEIKNPYTDRLFSYVNRLLDLAHATHQDLRAIRSGEVSNTYDASGFDAADAGAKSGLDTDIGSASYLQSWVAWF